MINYWSKEVITLLIYWFVVWLVGLFVGKKRVWSIRYGTEQFFVKGQSL